MESTQKGKGADMVIVDIMKYFMHFFFTYSILIHLNNKIYNINNNNYIYINVSLLLKWWWKLQDPQYNSLWKQIVKVKYSDNTHKFKMSSIWKDISALNQLGQTGKAVVLGDGQNTDFWHDRWYEECTLLSHFHHLFSLCQQPHIIVFEVMRSWGQALSFTRTLTGFFTDWI
jgi:hypothetical protein